MLSRRLSLIVMRQLTHLWDFSEGKHLNHLLRSPVGGGVFSDVVVDNTPSLIRQDYEQI